MNFRPTIEQYETRIGELHVAKKQHDAGKDGLLNTIQDLEDSVEKREQWRIEFQSDINRLKSQLLEKDEIITSLSDNLYSKAEQNKKLAESLNIFKNQLV